MSMSNEDVLKLIEKAKKQSKKLTHITDKKDLSTEDRFKLSLCKHFVQHISDKRIKIKDLSKLMNIPTPRLSEIANYKFKKFSVDQLLKYLTVLSMHSPRVRAHLALLEQVMEVPLMKVTETQKLTKIIREEVEPKYLYA